MILIILTVVGFLASLIGAVSGIGGGVMIKPVLDAITTLDTSVINFLSSCAVFSMSISASVKYYKEKVPFEKRTFLLGIGAVIGGLAGTQMFQLVISRITDDTIVKTIQNAVMLVLLTIIFIYVNLKNKPQYSLENKFWVLLIGVMLGIISAFLGIGGGPINIAVLTLFFSMDMKRATVNSIVLILFSQSSKIATLLISRSVPEQAEMPMLLCIILAAVIGGFIGSAVNKKIKSSKLKTIYNLVMLFVILTCLWNIISIF